MREQSTKSPREPKSKQHTMAALHVAPAAAAAKLRSTYLRDLLRGGAVFTKHARRTMKRRFIVCSLDLETVYWAVDARAYWANSVKGSLRLRDVVAVRRGRATSGQFFPKLTLKRGSHAQCCFSLVTPYRSLDLEAPNAAVADAWVAAFEEVCCARSGSQADSPHSSAFRAREGPWRPHSGEQDGFGDTPTSVLSSCFSDDDDDTEDGSTNVEDAAGSKAVRGGIVGAQRSRSAAADLDGGAGTSTFPGVASLRAAAAAGGGSMRSASGEARLRAAVLWSCETLAAAETRGGGRRSGGVDFRTLGSKDLSQALMSLVRSHVAESGMLSAESTGSPTAFGRAGSGLGGGSRTSDSVSGGGLSGQPRGRLRRRSSAPAMGRLFFTTSLDHPQQQHQQQHQHQQRPAGQAPEQLWMSLGSSRNLSRESSMPADMRVELATVLAENDRLRRQAHMGGIVQELWDSDPVLREEARAEISGVSAAAVARAGSARGGLGSSVERPSRVADGIRKALRTSTVV